MNTRSTDAAPIRVSDIDVGGHTVHRCGHWTQIEHPDRFHATLSAFLTTRSNP